MLIKTKTINLMAACLAAILVFVLMAVVEAKVTGVCSNCHTMHNSQGGVAVNAAGAGPQEFLLRNWVGAVSICWGCHAQSPGGSSNIITLGNVPQVIHAATTDLAAGNFKYIATVDNQGHNVIDYTANPESTLTTPPGDQNTTGVTNLNLTCAGQYGCHGNRAVTTGVGASMKGAHHAVDTALKFGAGFTTATQGTAVGNSYRFLLGVKGAEDTDWQATTAATDHNEYFGATVKGTESTKIIAGGNTISGLCAECHGYFHGPLAGDITSVTASPWLRHPTDIILPNSGEYASYTGATAYSFVAPIARQSIANATANASGAVNPGTDTLMCLSCHRAHASANFKLTRWDYKGALSTAISGCIVCHTSKN